MNKIKSLQVFFNEKKVGTLALMKNNIVAFEYDNEWINNGFSISPFSLPLKKQVFIPKIDPFDGLYGVFSDSLPDGWGRLLVDRMLNICQKWCWWKKFHQYYFFTKKELSQIICNSSVILSLFKNSF